MKWVSSKSPKILETNVHIHFHTFCEPPGNFTFLSHMLSTVSPLKESPALCSPDFSLSVGLHSVNAQSPLQSLCSDRSWWPVGSHKWVLSLNRWLVVGANRKSCTAKDRIFLTSWDLAVMMLSVRLSRLLSHPRAQPLIWPYNLLQRSNFAPPSGCIWSKESQKAQLGYPKVFKEVGKSVSSFSISLLITWGKTTQHLWT